MLGVLKDEVLVYERIKSFGRSKCGDIKVRTCDMLTIDRLATCPIHSRKVSILDHKLKKMTTDNDNPNVER